MPVSDYPDFHSREFLEQHARSILAFYEERVVAPDGFYQCFKDNGDVYDPDTRHLVSSTRFIFNYATAYKKYGVPHYKDWAEHGLKHLVNTHQQTNGNFAWILKNDSVTDGNAMAYGHAFVLLCAASCVQAGISTAKPLIEQSWNFVERYFWDESQSAYADERDTTLQELSPYRGQNANMHMCEALIAAWQATKDDRYLERAEKLANRFCFDLSQQSNGLIWEHYDTNWIVDMQYNIDKPDDLFKPWGFQPGHQVEWFGPDNQFCDSHKYFWVHAEAFAAAWRLFTVTGSKKYEQSYNDIWQWSWTYLIDHHYGAWFRIRNRDGSAFDDLKSPPGKTDYHTLGAVWDVLAQR